MAPYEALYGRRCRSPIGWFDLVDMDSLDTDLLRDVMEQVRMIQYRLLTAQSRQKSYADRRYIPDESHVLSLDSEELSPDFTFEEEPIAILDRQVRKLRTKKIALVKVQWKHRSVGEATWETETDMQARYPQLFKALGTFFYFMFEDEHDS
ncbi:uncharacterized protein [Solanum lycopersicum]|uniref:uncharacterized protein n=1 Tax=Solanum lycopersicum TaxID=4081 RepID=UPI003748F4A9